MSHERSLSELIGVIDKGLTTCATSRISYPFHRIDKHVADRALTYKNNEP